MYQNGLHAHSSGVGELSLAIHSWGGARVWAKAKEYTLQAHHTMHYPCMSILALAV